MISKGVRTQAAALALFDLQKADGELRVGASLHFERPACSETTQ